MDYSVLSPYIIPPELRNRKKANIGDGFILHRILRLLQPSMCSHVFSTRAKLGDEDLEKINSTKALVLAGANQLNDNYSIVPGFDLFQTRRIKIPIIPLGIGISGDRKKNVRMSENTRSILREIHDRIKISSWRCPVTIDYLSGQLPDIADRFLLTGCPVIFDDNLLNQIPFRSATEKVVVTVTERDDFWERETRTIDYVRNAFDRSERYLSLHQSYDFPAVSKWSNLFPSGRKKLSRRKRIDDLHRYAMDRGFSVVIPDSVESCLTLYDGLDLHMGSRLHAHLFFLSQAKRSFLTYVDERMKGFSNMLEFPLCDYNRFDDYMGYDFEVYRQKSIDLYESMKKFILYLKSEML